MADYMAREMYEAVNGIGTAEGTLVEILCSGTNQEIRDINAAYLRRINDRIVYVTFNSWINRVANFSVRPSDGKGYQG